MHTPDSIEPEIRFFTNSSVEDGPSRSLNYSVGNDSSVRMQCASQARLLELTYAVIFPVPSVPASALKGCDDELVSSPISSHQAPLLVEATEDAGAAEAI
jgi:hypothetical protein